MKIGLIGINSQFVHSNLALYYLREELPPSWEGELLEYNNNEPLLRIFYDIESHHFDVVAFSVYLWNKETVIKLTQLFRSSLPETKILLGGPEPTYAPGDFPFFDYIIYGALEVTFAPLLECMERDELCSLPGIRGEVQFADEWKFPYHESDLPRLKNRLVYYETSRGCPYRCAFCLSSAEKRTAFRPMERVKKELDFFLEHQIPVVKLVDRTFNTPKERGKEILRYLLNHYRPGVTFHFELKGELLDDETVELLTSAPRGYFQIEIGVQSLNEAALAESERHNRWEKTKLYYKRLIESENVHTHFDLIAALPHEDLDSFVRGFDEVMSLEPHYLQLGFLKLLPGTKLAAEKKRFGYAAESFPPYEVVKSKDISVSELSFLKKMDAFMDGIYNKGRLKQTLHYAMKRKDGGAFQLFSRLDPEDIVKSLEDLLPEGENVWESLSRLDGFLWGCGGNVTPEEEKAVQKFVQDRERISALLPHYGQETPREIYKRVRMLHFPVKLIFSSKGMVEEVIPGETWLLLDCHEKGKQKRGKKGPTVYLL